MRISCWFKNAILSHPTQKEAYQWIPLASVNTSDYAGFSFYLSFYPSTCSWQMLSQCCLLLWEPAMVHRTIIPSVCHLLSLDLNLEWSNFFRKALFLHVTAAEIQDSFSLAWSPWGTAWSISLSLSTPRLPLQGLNSSRDAPFTELPLLGRLFWPFGLTKCQRSSNKTLAEHCVLSREIFCNGSHLCCEGVSFLCLSNFLH